MSGVFPQELQGFQAIRTQSGKQSSQRAANLHSIPVRKGGLPWLLLDCDQMPSKRIDSIPSFPCGLAWPINFFFSKVKRISLLVTARLRYEVNNYLPRTLPSYRSPSSLVSNTPSASSLFFFFLSFFSSFFHLSALTGPNISSHAGNAPHPRAGLGKRVKSMYQTMNWETRRVSTKYSVNITHVDPSRLRLV